MIDSIGFILIALCLSGSSPAGVGQSADRDTNTYVEQRKRMVAQQIASGIHGIAIRDPLVLKAMRHVPRHEFVLPDYKEMAYSDRPLPIAANQTISQPFIVALMTELADIRPGDRVLEIGTGSGYQAAILASITDEIYSIEIIEELASAAKKTLSRLGYQVHVASGDGYLGWPEAAPFDAILVTAAAPRLPQPLIEQLGKDGRLVIPLGETFQDLYVFRKKEGKLERQSIIPVRFVPMTGQIQEPNDE